VRKAWKNLLSGKADFFPRARRMTTLLFALAAATSVAYPQTPDKPDSSKQVTSAAGTELFEAKCAACHGLDGRGGEHAPDIAGAPSVRFRSDAQLLQIIRGGVVAKGMPSFLSLGDQKICALVGHLHFLQGPTATLAVNGDSRHGKELFQGKGGCANCHAMKGSGSFISTDLSDFASKHNPSEIREAILNPGRDNDPGQTAVVATTTAGGRYSGLIRNENNSSLQIQDAQGRFYLLMKSNLRNVQRSPGPPMPVNYLQQLGKKNIEDLVSYIVLEASNSKPEDDSPTVVGLKSGTEEASVPPSMDSSACKDH
jgi:cytochrome c oxidase cbb3-type subunit III